MLRAAEGGGVAARAGFKDLNKMWTHKALIKRKAYSTCWEPESDHGDAYGADPAPKDGDGYLNGYNYDSCCWEGDDGNGGSQEGKGFETCWDGNPVIEGGPKEDEKLPYTFERCCRIDWDVVDCKYDKEQMEEQFRKRVGSEGVDCTDLFGPANGGEDCPAKCKLFFPTGSFKRL